MRVHACVCAWMQFEKRVRHVCEFGLFFFNEMRNDLADRCVTVQALVLLGRSNKNSTTF